MTYDRVCWEIYRINASLNLLLDLGQTPQLCINITKTNRNYDIPLDPTATTIVLNVSPQAISNWHVDVENGYVFFSARFNGISHDISIPCETIESVINNDQKNPMCFSMTGELTWINNPNTIDQPKKQDTFSKKQKNSTKDTKRKKNHLTLVK